MEQAAQPKPLTHLTKFVPLRSICLSLDDVKAIYDRLALIVDEQADAEIGALVKPENKSDDEWAEYIKAARENAFKIITTIAGRDGSSLMGADASVFSAANRPDKISSIFMSNVAAYENFARVKPVNNFSVNLDFTKPLLLEWGTPLSAPTSNASNVSVEGNRDGWVASVHAAVSAVVDQRRVNRNWLHRAFGYDFGLFLLGLPFALYLCWKTSGMIQRGLGSLHQIVAAAAYVYLFFFALFIYRGLFGYAKWAFPTMELSNNKDSASSHRVVMGAVMLGIVVDVLWELRNVL